MSFLKNIYDCFTLFTLELWKYIPDEIKTFKNVNKNKNTKNDSFTEDKYVKIDIKNDNDEDIFGFKLV